MTQARPDMTLVRNFVGVIAYGYAARKIVVDASLQAARTRDDLSDIINVALEELPAALRASRLQHAVEDRPCCSFTGKPRVSSAHLRNAGCYCQAEAVCHFDPPLRRAA